jgi:2-methylcitrate dehydratase PrpD
VNGGRKAAEFIVHARWDALPEAVQRQARMCLVDDLGATLSGTGTRISRITADYAVETWPGDEATLLLHGRRANAVGAAFANGWSANGLDIDDGIRYAYGHAGAQLFPTALAVAEARDLSGEALLTGLVVGYEVAHRVGRCWHDHHEVYQACGSWGSVGCAAAAAHLLGLTVEQAEHALGIAEYFAPNLPMMRDVDHPAMVKHGIGWGAMTGVISAQLAGRGFTGIPSILSFDRYQDWAKDIGEQYIMPEGITWKKKGYACCGWAHPAAEGAWRLKQAHDFDVAEIRRIRVEGPHGAVRLGTRLPTTTEEAQFNVAWPVAAMLVDGEIGPPQTTEERLDDPQLRALARKVEVVETDELNELCRLRELGDPEGKFAGVVTITLQDGRELNSGLVGEPPFPQPDWDAERMAEKFRWITGFVLDEGRVDALLDTLWHFEELPNVRPFAQELSQS